MNYSMLELVNRMPSTIGPDDTDRPFPKDIIGARVVRVATPEDSSLIEGGGLVIDYVPAYETRVVRLVLGFTELGMWIQFCGDLEA